MNKARITKYMRERLTAKDIPGGVWSAAPTPFTAKMEIDVDSVERMVEHHVRLGVKGLFLCGTNGEGPWLTDERRRMMVQSVVRFSRGRLPVAVQVTDNSAARIIDNMQAVKEDGADIAVIAPPFFLNNATPMNILRLYREAIRGCPLPVGIYDRGKYSSVLVPDSILKDIYAEKKVVMIKDSSTMPERMKIALAAKLKRPDIKLLDGDEFHCVDYLKAGYDGLLLGGGVFNGYLANMIVKAVAEGDLQAAQKFQERMNRMMYAVYGGKKIRCWLAGEKQLLVKMGIFRTEKNCLGYALTDSCRRAIERVIKTEAAVLMP